MKKSFSFHIFPQANHRKIHGFPVSTETYRIKKTENKTSISFFRLYKTKHRQDTKLTPGLQKAFVLSVSNRFHQILKSLEAHCHTHLLCLLRWTQWQMRCQHRSAGSCQVPSTCLPAAPGSLALTPAHPHPPLPCHRSQARVIWSGLGPERCLTPRHCPTATGAYVPRVGCQVIFVHHMRLCRSQVLSYLRHLNFKAS